MAPQSKTPDTVLVVDDEPKILALVAAALRTPSRRVLEARTGADAIALVQVDGPVAEKVLADIRKLPLVKQAKTLAF